MKVVVVGASGNVGTALLEALGQEPPVQEVVGIARRLPEHVAADDSHDDPAATTVTWQARNIATDEIDDLLTGADAVVQLAWLFQPTHRRDVTWQNNVMGTLRVLEAVERCGVGAFVYSSSVGAYSPRESEDRVDESWPTHGASSAAYAREKAYVERLVDLFDLRTPACRVVRMRPAFVFHRRAAAQQRRLFGGPLVPGSLVHPEVLPVLPLPAGLVFQTVHADDVGRAFCAVVVQQVSGAFNICADQILDSETLAGMFDAKVAPVPPRLLRAAVSVAWRAHAVPASPDLLDAFMAVPMMDNTRAKAELGWTPRATGEEALSELLAGLQEGSGYPTPPLDRDAGGAGRVREFLSGVGRRP